jgi:hypothetical protein
MKVLKIRLHIDHPYGIGIQDYVLEQDHVLSENRASFSGRWRRTRTDFGRVPAILREDFAFGVVNTGVTYVLFGLQCAQNFACGLRIVESKGGRAVRSDHFRGSNQIRRLRTEECSPIIDCEYYGGHEQSYATSGQNNALKLMTDGHVPE